LIARVTGANGKGVVNVADGILDGKLALVAGVANKRSIAWAIAQALHGAGAQLAFTYQGERLEGGVRKLAAEAESGVVVECDVSADASIDRAFEQVGEELGGLDIFVHSIAFAPQDTFTNRFIETSRDAFQSLVSLHSVQFRRGLERPKHGPFSVLVVRRRRENDPLSIVSPPAQHARKVAPFRFVQGSSP